MYGEELKAMIPQYQSIKLTVKAWFSYILFNENEQEFLGEVANSRVGGRENTRCTWNIL